MLLERRMQEEIHRGVSTGWLTPNGKPLISCSQFQSHRMINRFCQIAYMFERQETLKCKYGSKPVTRKYFHARWLQHGSQMLLQETAHPNGLFYLNECDDLPVECIYRRCNLRVLGPDEPEPIEEPSDLFFARYVFRY